ncbi:hypothetical protein [Nisaea sediminum]|uniref:hypothetical protein n=1 Tax=Nisaea sediminum TaxID=2775867 RepID=UPI0018676F71|nr:hypothetical protein [Nisaea sediminum]
METVIAKVIDILGGREAVRERYGQKYLSSISNWIRNDRFPEYLHHRIARDMSDRGYDFDPETNVLEARDAA